MAENPQAKTKRLHSVTKEQWELAHLQLKEALVIDKTPFSNLTDFDISHPDQHLLSIMMNPDYFGWTCSKLFNTAVSDNGLELLPMQCAILREMWYRPFPMLIATRGFGKSFTLALYTMLRALFIQGRKIVITGAGFRQSKIVFSYAELLWHNSPIFRDLCGASHDKNQGPHHDTDVWWMQIGESQIKALPLGDGCLGKMSNIAKEDCFSTIEFPVKSIWGNGKYRASDEHYVNGVQKTKIVKTKKGFGYEGTYNHGMKVVRNGKIDWVRTDEMVIGDKILIDRSYRWHNGKSFISEEDAYVLGCFVGDGCYTMDDRLLFATKDKEFIPKIDSFLKKYYASDSHMKWSGEKDECHYRFYTPGVSSDFCRIFGIDGRRTIDKSFPKEILKAERNKVAAFISGLFDTDETLQVSTTKGGFGVTVSFTNTSEKLVDELQFILLHFGIISNKTHRDRDEKWNRVYELLITGPDVAKFDKEIGFRLKRKDDLLKAGLSNKSRNYGCGDTIPDIQADMVAIARSVRIKKGSCVDRGISASKIQQKKGISHDLAQRFLAVYGYIDDPRIEKIRTLTNPDIYYDEIVSIESSEAETFDIHVPDGNEYCANGFFSHNSKIRGQRAHDIIADEFACLSYLTLINTPNGMFRIGECESTFKELDLYTGNNSELEKPTKFIRTPLTDVYKITTEYGYTYKCSGIHQTYTKEGFKLAKDLTTSDLLEFKNVYRYPTKYVVVDDIKVDENLGWLMGILIAEGSINNDCQIQVKMIDEKCIDKINEAWLKFDSNIKIGKHSNEFYEDRRGWVSKKSYVSYICNKKIRSFLINAGLNKTNVYDKIVPWSILQSPKSVMISFLAGLFEGDGSAFLWKDRKIPNKLGVSYYSVSEQLCTDIQAILQTFGIVSQKLSRKSKLSNKLQWMIRLNSINAIRLADMLDIRKWDYAVQNCYRPKEGFYKENPEYLKVRSVELLPEKEHLYDFYLPDSHSFVGNCFKQHNSIPQQVFEEVVAGFGVVNLDPIEQIKHYQRMEYLSELGDVEQALKKDESFEKHSGFMPNQTIISGTASFAFNHFYAYWKKQRDVITSKGDSRRLKDLGLDPNLDHRKYSIMRIPVDMLPKGFMDEAHVQRSKSTVSVGIYENEFGACFSADSSGFYRRSILERSMPSFRNPVVLPSGDVVEVFQALLKGDPKKKYVMAVDTASERDKFAIVILEINPDHARIVYCWTTDRQEHIELRSKGVVAEKDFYAFTHRKIRNLMKLFNVVHIAMDSQGGGRTISELLHNDRYLEEGEQLIWEMNDTNPLWDGKERSSDNEPGLHILEMCNFADNKYISDSNHGMKHDFEQRILLFPYFDALEVVLADKEDFDAHREYDTLQDVLMEIDDLKDELQTIQHDATPSGRETWKVPTVKESGDVGRLYDDRYAALLMANSAARRLRIIPKQQEYYVGGGFVGQIQATNSPKKTQLYSGPAWYTEGIKNIGVYGIAVKR